MDSLNIDTTQPDIEEKLARLKQAIVDKLTKGYGYELQDDSLSTWIIAIVIDNNKPKNEFKEDLVEFIADNSEDFTTWLWQEAPKICSAAKPEPVKQSQPAKVTKPQKSDAKEQQSTASVDTKKSSAPKDKADRLLKKAIGDATKSSAKDRPKAQDKSSYVHTDKDGRKIISLKKQGHESGRSRDDSRRSDKRYSRDNRDTNVLNRIRTNKQKDEDKGISKLDMSLDSVIQKQKEKQYTSQTRDWHTGKKHGRYEVTEEFIHDPSADYKKTFKRPKRGDQYDVDEVDNNPKPKQYNVKEGEGEGEEAPAEPSKGYKGKKFNPFYAMGGYMGGPGYGYGMYGMDPYMMSGYYGYKPPYFKPKKFKNKSLVVKKDDKGKAEPSQPTSN